MLIGALLFVIVIILAQTIALREHENLNGKIKAECDHLVALVEMDIRSRIPALKRYIRHWDEMGGIPREEFIREMESFEADTPGFQAIEWCDNDAIIRWAVPLEGNERAINLNMNAEANRSATLRKARQTKDAALSDPISLVQGGYGIIIAIPVYVGGKQNGYLLAVFKIREWMQYVFGIQEPKPGDGNFRVIVTMDQKPFYAQAGWETLPESAIETASSFWMFDHKFTISIRPETAYLRQYTTRTPILLTLFGALISILVSSTIWLYQRSNEKTWNLQISQKTLEKEIAERKKVETELHRAFTRIDLATKAAQMGVWSWNLANDQLTWDLKVFELFDVHEDITPKYETWRNAVHPDDRERAEKLLKDAVLGKGVFNTEFRVIRSDGSVRYIRAAARLELDENGKPCFMNGLNWDITESKKAETALKKSEERVRLLLDSTGEAIYGIDLDGNCTFANQSCARILGYPETGKFLGKNMHTLIHHSYQDGTARDVEDCKIYQAFREGKPSHVDDEVLWKADGSPFPAEYWSYPQIVNGEITGAVVAFIDITERKKAEETIRHMATHDGLTNLPSLLLCKDRLSMAIARANRDGTLAAVFFIDLDGFKSVNDTHGHDAGDSVLRETARRLRASVRESDTIARIGGDEFLAVIPELHSRKNAETLARKILDAVSTPYGINTATVSIGASVGIALFPRDSGDDVENLIKLADQAMYRVKKSGKNGFRFAED
jgi:diguanylate cyclase (GGDEF)-like protein/PAS domain S-box-containing protein